MNAPTKEMLEAGAVALCGLTEANAARAERMEEYTAAADKVRWLWTLMMAAAPKEVALKPANEPAYPTLISNAYGLPVTEHKGMTLRDHFAGQAMQARLSRQPDPLPAPQWFQSGHEVGDALICYAVADAMLEARSK